MKTEQLMIGRIPAGLYGGPPDAVFFFPPGEMGCDKEGGGRFPRAPPPGGLVVFSPLPPPGTREGNLYLPPISSRGSRRNDYGSSLPKKRYK